MRSGYVALLISTLLVATLVSVTYFYTYTPLYAAPEIVPTPKPTPVHHPFLGGGAPYVPPTPTPTSTPYPSSPPYPPSPDSSSNWAGYAALSNLTSPESLVTSVAASWIVPSVNTSLTDTYSAIWVGVGGVTVGGNTDWTLIQTGTMQNVVSGVAEYSAWYELLPDSSISIDNITVSPGDSMEATVSLLNSTENLWNINITNVSTEEGFCLNVTYASAMLSADWVVERPLVNLVLSNLSDFGNATFINCTATLATTGPINNFPNMQIIMYDNLTPLVSVSDLSEDGTQFTVTYSGTQ